MNVDTQLSSDDLSLEVRQNFGIVRLSTDQNATMTGWKYQFLAWEALESDSTLLF